MYPGHRSTPRPPLIIDADQLNSLQGALRMGLQSAPEVTDLLIEEIDRAEVRPSQEVPETVVTLGSWVTYRNMDDGSIRTVKLVLPGEADLAKQRVSVLTPIGAALIGLSEGQVMPWTVGGEQAGTLTVLRTTKQPPIPARTANTSRGD
ncbi:regulator of nucleoside diphosphate kinase [Panacagrimonas perspica]|uniref:Regulator of nucleoside diphosphate kinase n=1 Tax=Panacagrimonas perspica TaxID=381431 RepID=A0A4R7NRI7_9GAMM|nr:nucleoside diphosphate kinase regulator [Panacagrimonas perspica]TDU23302.1 regulator of nucleoside diphosphate kinase [Panacagrimonas perspica]THD02499.1 hypothetical protein B1810_14335 [Panacagrimonas perspica]